MRGYFAEDGHRSLIYVQDPDEISFEPQQSAKLRQLGLKRRPVKGDGNCYYYAVADQLGKPTPDNLDTCTQMRYEIGFYLRSNQNLWQTDIENLVNHPTSDEGPMSTRAYNMTIANKVEKNKKWADDDIVVAATAVAYQRDIVILYCGTSLGVRTQALGIRRNGSPVFGYRMYVPWVTLLPWCLQHNPLILLYDGGSDRRGTHFDSTEPLVSRTQMPSLARPNTPSLFANGCQTTGYRNSVTQNTNLGFHTSSTKVRPTSVGILPTPSTDSFVGASRMQMPSLARPNTPSQFAEGFQTTGHHNSVSQKSDLTWHTSSTKARPLSFGVTPTPTTNSFATLENLCEDGVSEKVHSNPPLGANPNSSSSKVAMSIHDLKTPPPKPMYTEGMELLGVVSSAGKTSHTYVPIIQTPPNAHSPGKREARGLVNRSRVFRAKITLENKRKNGRPKGAKDKNPRAARGSKRTKKKTALPKESA
eukprot:CAMPEP_0198232398 /NCGR_PEP_ID=MMETSP1445-20131203/115710_1 /TAXON_ID=36898 /ORGANISM="Pyramimonas sp., Strain CCMP2087" /LENGTH=474 /DNA_ID=CAMNT_0043913069 /DNA_START=717 /DNA_END=2137 /DNA_ORIENTATION=-